MPSDGPIHLLPDTRVLDLLEDDPLAACDALDAMLMDDRQVAAWCNFQTALGVCAESRDRVSDAIIARARPLRCAARRLASSTFVTFWATRHGYNRSISAWRIKSTIC